MKITIPSGLDLNQIIKENELYSWYSNNKNIISRTPSFVKGKKIKKHISKCYYFLNLIIQNSDKPEYRCKLNQYKDYTKIIVGRDNYLNYNTLKQIIHLLVKLNIIKVQSITELIYFDNKSKNTPIKYFKIIYPYTSTIIIDIDLKSKKQTITKQQKERIFNNQSYTHQYNQQSKLNFNYLQAKEHTNYLYKHKFINNNQFCAYYNTIFYLEDKHFHFTVSDTCNRVFTTVNNIPKNLRGFIMDNDNNSLIELDYKTCIPNILVKVLSDYITKKNITDFNLINEIEAYKHNLSIDIYNHIIDVFKSNNIDIDRTTAKDIVLHHWINQNPKYTTIESKIMSMLYPNITKIMNQIKGEYLYTYKNFYNNIMKEESYIVNQLVYTSFINKYPDGVIYTIHDAFIVEEKYIEQLKKIMIFEASNYLKINMDVKIN